MNDQQLSRTIQHLHLNEDDRYDENQQRKFTDFVINNQYDYQIHKNPHDIAGSAGLVEVQNKELDIKKVQFRIQNELYLREHPELNDLISVFLFKLLEEKPSNIISYAGQFFDRKGLKEIINIEKEHYFSNI